MFLDNGSMPVAERLVEDTVRKHIIEEKLFIIVILPCGGPPRITCLVNGTDKVVCFDSLDIHSKPLVGETDTVCMLLKELVTFWQGLVSHLKINTIVCLDGTALIGIIIGHIFNKELGCPVLQGIRIILEVCQDLLHFWTILPSLLKGLLGNTVARHEESCP